MFFYIINFSSPIYDYFLSLKRLREYSERVSLTHFTITIYNGCMARKSGERNYQKTHDSIIRAGLYIGGHSGLQAVTGINIGRKISISPASVFYHFKDKKSLLDICYVTSLQHLKGDFKKIFLTSEPGAEGLRKLYDEFVSNSTHRISEILYLINYVYYYPETILQKTWASPESKEDSLFFYLAPYIDNPYDPVAQYHIVNAVLAAAHVFASGILPDTKGNRDQSFNFIFSPVIKK